MSFPAGNVHDVDDEVPPGWSHTYTWGGWYQSGPGMDDDECVPWVFHSHASNVQKDIHSGPVGVVLVCNPNRSAMQGRSKLSYRSKQIYLNLFFFSKHKRHSLLNSKIE